MRRTPKIQFKIVGLSLLLVAAALLIFSLSTVPSYHNIFDQPWEKQFVSELVFNFYKTAFREVCFVAFPLIALFQIWAAWNILTCAKKHSRYQKLTRRASRRDKLGTWE
jgi:hypothetical protein